MATTPGGLTYPIATDAFDPSGDMADLAASADAGRIIAVPNVAARTALAAALATRPLYVHRQDAEAGARLEVTEDGTTWQTVWSGDTGWVSVSTGGGFSGDPAYRVIAGVCHLRGAVTRTAGAYPAGQTDTITLPAAATPTRLVRGAPTFYNTNPPTGIAVDVATSGLITVRAGGAAASASVYLGGINYPVA